MPQRELRNDLPNASVNLARLLHMCDPKKVRQSDWGAPILNTELARYLNCQDSRISRILRGAPIRDEEREKIFEFFKLTERDGWSPRMLDWAPVNLVQKLEDGKWGRFAGISADENWLTALQQGRGWFVPEALLSILRYRGDPYRGTSLGIDDDGGEIPNASAVIGSRYGLVIDVDEAPVEAALADGTAFAVVVHRDRITKKVTLHVSPRTMIGKLEWGILRTGGLAGPTTALLADHDDHDGAARTGYLIGGKAGLRDVCVFLFAHRPRLGSGWASQDAEPLLDDARGETLRKAVEDAHADHSVTATRLVYNALLP